jgi:hypothetical protein
LYCRFFGFFAGTTYNQNPTLEHPVVKNETFQRAIFGGQKIMWRSLKKDLLQQ